MVNQRDMLLVPFPFSDQSGKKVRPVLIISNNQYNNTSGDVIICAISSNLMRNKYTILIEQENLEQGQLYDKSAIKVDTILKIDKSLIISSIGKLNTKTFQRVLDILDSLFKTI